MVKRLLKFAKVKDEETRLVGDLVSLHFLVIFAFIIAKTARDGLYLSELPARTLPYVYLGLAFWTALAIVVYGRYFGRFDSHRALMHGLWGTAVTLVLFFFWFRLYPGTPAVVFYLWIGAYGILLVSQFWILANDRINPRQARRLFGIIGAGGILGGMAGGAAASQLVRAARPEWLLVVAGCAHILAAAIAARSGRRPEEAPPEGTETTDDAAAGIIKVLGLPYVRLIAATLLVGGITAAVVDYEFKVLLQSHFAAPGEIGAGLGAEAAVELTTFLGYVYAFQNVVMLVVQLGLTGLILSRLGARSASMLLPGGLLAGSLLTVAFPHVLAVSGTWLYESIARVSVVRSAREFLYFPLRGGIRQQAKRLMETVVKRSAEGAAGAIIILVNVLLGGTILQLSALVAALSVAALMLERFLSRRYTAEMSDSLRWMLDEKDRPRYDYKEAHLVREFYGLLESEYERRVLYAVNALRDVDPVGLSERLPALLNHKSPKVRARSLELSAQQNVTTDLERVEPLLVDSDDEVRMHAAYFYCCLQPGDPRQSMGGLLQSDNEKVRSGAFQCVAAHSPPEDDEKVEAIGKQLLEGGVAADRLTVATAAGRRPPPARIHGYLLELIHDKDPAVRTAAIRSAGSVRYREVVPDLIALLKTREFGEAAEYALVTYGNHVVGTLGDYLADPNVPFAIRASILKVLSRIGTQASANAILNVFLDENAGYADRLLRALGRIRANNPGVVIHQAEISKRVSIEVTQYLTFHRCRRIVEDVEGERARDLLVRVLWERTGQSLRRLFRTLALIYPRKETRLAYRGLMSKNVRLRAQAVEYIETVLSSEHRRMVIPIVEEAGTGESKGTGSEQPIEAALQELAGIPDPWLVAAVLYAAGALKVVSLAPLARTSIRASHPYVREMGRWAAGAMVGEN
jgi:AAA family ATP:ADP antiporter